MKRHFARGKVKYMNLEVLVTVTKQTSLRVAHSRFVCNESPIPRTSKIHFIERIRTDTNGWSEFF